MRRQVQKAQLVTGREAGRGGIVTGKTQKTRVGRKYLQNK